MDFILRFDPGGRNRFGWSLDQTAGNELGRSKTGWADAAQDAIDQGKGAIKALADATSGNPRILATGIAAPMFWSSRGNRAVAAIIRKALVANGFASGKVGGAVQAVNALRGACSAPGVLWGKYRHETCNSKITEAHPTALLYLLQASGQVGTIISRIGGLNDPEQDAPIAGFAAWSMLKPPPGWRDLYQEEPSPVRPFDTPAGCWMPIPKAPSNVIGVAS